MDKPGLDYPAAHSMDTEWYAVDADGHVGLFESGEEGAVPHGVGTRDDTPREIEDALPEQPFRLLDWLGDDRQEHHVELPSRRRRKGLGRTLMFLTSLDPVGRDVERFGADHAAATEGVAVLYRDLPVETVWRLHEAGSCLGCFPWVEGEEWHDLHDDRPRRVGLFHFRQGSSSLAKAYTRDRMPDRPIQIHEVPPDLRDIVGRLRLADLRFAEAEKIQPVGLVPCSSWGGAYLDLDGVTVRPVPGREADFDAEAWSKVPGLRVEVPTTPPPGRRRRRT